LTLPEKISLYNRIISLCGWQDKVGIAYLGFGKSINLALGQTPGALNENVKKEFGYSFPESNSLDSLTKQKDLSSRVFQTSVQYFSL